jgi:hypothetical protein
LSESATRAEGLEIPGELKLSNPLPRPMAVSLPLVARPRILANVLLGLLALPIGVLLDFSFVVLLIAAMHGGLYGSTGFIVVVFLSLSFVSGVIFTGAALTCFADALRTGPVLEITAEGLLDRRSGLSIAWSNVPRAEITSGGTASVDFALRGASELAKSIPRRRFFPAIPSEARSCDCFHGLAGCTPARARLHDPHTC